MAQGSLHGLTGQGTVFAGLRVIDGGKSARGKRQEYGLARLVPVIRERLDIDARFPDDAILAGLVDIAAARSVEAKWQAAFRSNLGLVLSLRSGDLSERLDFVIEMVSRAGIFSRPVAPEGPHAG